MIKDVLEDAFGDYGDKKKFLEQMSKKYAEMQAKIYEYEQFDRMQREESHWKMTLQKREYFIPEIEIPPTQVSELYDEEAEESESESSQVDSVID